MSIQSPCLLIYIILSISVIKWAFDKISRIIALSGTPFIRLESNTILLDCFLPRRKLRSTADNFLPLGALSSQICPSNNISAVCTLYFSDFARKNDVEQCFFSVNPKTSSLVIQMHMFEMYAKRGRTDLFFNIIRETSEFVFRKIDGETICLELSFPFQWI